MGGGEIIFLRKFNILCTFLEYYSITMHSKFLLKNCQENGPET